ncbi:HNH endonuclease signature motif containing protein [Sphingomonas sp. CARO-RG-8B-R24-01]|uniref:HNH endonuclease signature motif containing protein n=1 Tax=Sphingomonas sp. CARO-RG-8B-R24-01 TaxID=2914831 RepID=UPI0032202124
MVREAARVERLRGRAGQAQRRRRLEAEPLCRRCAERGRVTAATVPDHIVPLAHGGADDDINIRCLCGPCHDEVTAEQFGHRRVVGTDGDGWPLDQPTRNAAR